MTPELGLFLNWNPREKTQFSIGATQTEQFANSLSGEYLVTRGIYGTISQKLFSAASLTFTGGYANQEYINLSPQSTPGQSSSQLPTGNYYAGLSVLWRLSPWATLLNSLTSSTGQQTGGSGSTAKPQYLYTISLNLGL